MKMKLLVPLLIFFASPGAGEETEVSTFSSPKTVEVQVPESINPEEGLALHIGIKDPIEEGGGEVDSENDETFQKDEGKIHFTALVTGGEVKADTIAVGPETVNHTMPLCFDPHPKDFSSLKFVKVTTISDLKIDKGITFSLIKFDCSSIIFKADDTGVSPGVIVIIVIVCLLLVIVGFGLYVYFARPPTIVNWWNNLMDTHHDPENKEQTELPLLEGQTDNVKVVPCSVDITNEIDRNNSMKPGKEEEKGKEKDVNSNSVKKVKNDVVPQVISKAKEQNDIDLKKKQLERIEQIKANKAKKDKVNASDDDKVINSINNTNVVNNYVRNITVVGSDSGTLPYNFTDETNGNNSMKPGKEEECDAEKPLIKTVIAIKDNVPHSSTCAINEGDSSAVTKPDSQTDKVHQISSDTNKGKEKGVNSNSDKKVKNDAVPQVTSKAKEQCDFDLKKKQSERIEQIKANKQISITVLRSDTGTLPHNYTDENVMNEGVGLPDEDIEMRPQSEIDDAELANTATETREIKIARRKLPRKDYN